MRTNPIIVLKEGWNKKKCKSICEDVLNNVKDHMSLVSKTIEQLRKEGRSFEESEYQFSAYDNYSDKKM